MKNKKSQFKIYTIFKKLKDLKYSFNNLILTKFMIKHVNSFYLVYQIQLTSICYTNSTFEKLIKQRLIIIYLAATVSHLQKNYFQSI